VEAAVGPWVGGGDPQGKTRFPAAIMREKKADFP
jgi:hypothetical protein